MKDRGYCFNSDEEYLRATLKVTIQSMGTVDTIAFEQMASFIGDLFPCFNNNLTGRVLLIESIAWLEETYRASKQIEKADYLLEDPQISLFETYPK